MKNKITHVGTLRKKGFEGFISGVRYLSILAFLFFFSLLTIKSVAQLACCPSFKLKDAVTICPPEGACHSNSSGLGGGAVACKLTAHTYTIYPNLPGFVYTWTVTGGTPATFTGNPAIITWGSGATGFIKVVISNLASGGNCIDSLSQEICLIDGPQANFTIAAATVCTGTPVHFTNTSLGGSIYLWDFGDGTTSSMANPPDHIYTTPGNYTVTLTATDAGPSSSPAQRAPCGCISTISKIVTVLSGTGPTITTGCCYGTVCPGDTSAFCTPLVCGTYTWSVTGGIIVSGAGTSCIKVKWNAVYTVPTTVTLAVPGCAAAPCPGSTTIFVPVLYPNLPISGPNPVCVGASGSFFLPSMPGTFYTWTTTAAAGTYSFNDNDRNVANVNITFNAPGTYQIICVYNNPETGCSGTSIFNINVLPVFLIFPGNDIVCQGSTVTYFANATATWAAAPAGAIVPPGPSTSSAITWNTPGTYTITATPTIPGVFCNSNAIKVVQVKAVPILGPITGPILMCPGKHGTYSITSNTTGSPFVWAITSGTGSVQTQFGTDHHLAIVLLTGTGPWTIGVYQQIEISPGVFCQSLTQTLVVNPYGTPTVTGPTSVCVDAITTYNASGPTPPGGFQWTIILPNQGTILSGQGTSSVSIRWHGPPNSAVVTATSCGGSGSVNVTILNPPAIPPINPNGPLSYCLPNMPNLLTLSVPNTYSTYQWYLNGVPIGGATTFSYTIPNATFIPPSASYVFMVVVSNGLCSVSNSVVVLIGNCTGGGGPPNPIPCSVDFTINPNPACENQPVTFTIVPPDPGFSLQWAFGDGATSFQSPTEHSYLLAGVYSVTVTATLGSCIATKVHTVTINPTPTCNITVTDTIYCPGSFVTFTGCTGMSSYQWFKDGSPISGATSIGYNAGQYGEYWLEVSNIFGCTNTSNHIFIYERPLPTAKITGDGSVCAFAGGLSQFTLSSFYNGNYSYSWSSLPAGATFLPNNSNSAYITTASITLPAVLPYSANFIVKVTDMVTGCINYDTICITFYQTPAVSVPFYSGCEGTSVTLTPVPANPTLYNYQWSNGKTTTSITVSMAGFYSLTIIDKATGCSASVNAANIFPKPDLSLFPLGCKTIKCKDTLNLYLPLPLTVTGPFSTYPGGYPVINWYDNGNYAVPIGSGKHLAFSTTVGGTHQISVIVQNIYGCADTAGVFCLTVNYACDTLDFGDAPDNPAGGFNYATLLVNNGARHKIVPGVFMGSKVDGEPDGQPSIGADCDDNDCLYPSGGDDEDGVTIPAVVEQGANVSITVVASVAGYLDAWMDFNINGTWADAGEHIFITQPLTPGPNTLVFVVPVTATVGQSYARFRFRTTKTPINYYGLVNDGEVEDYAVYIDQCSEGDQLDYGDAPDDPANGFNYPTLLAHNGARHVMYTNIRLGALIDPETDGQPNITATGDNISGLNDEDGVLFVGTMYVGMPANVKVTASVPGFLNAWMDFNKNGTWADAGEQIFVNQPLVAGVNNLTFNIPATAVQGKTYARFRFNTTGGLTYYGLALNGEVEDYQVRSCPHWVPVHTSLKHYITIPHDLQNLNPGDVLGVFFHDNNGNLQCGGLSEFDGVNDMLMIAYGDDPVTPVKDGFAVGEPFIWKLCSIIKGDANTVDVVYDPTYPNYNGVFVVNGFSALMNVIGLHVVATAVPGIVCPGDPVQLQATVQESTAGVTFSWTSLPAGFTSNEQNPVTNPAVTTTYYVDAFDGVFHATSSTNVIVTVVSILKDTLLLRNITIPASHNNCYNAINTITVAGDGTTFTIESSGNAQLVAGQNIILLPGTKVLSGGIMHAYISPTGASCCSPKGPEQANLEQGIVPLPDANQNSSFFRVYPNPTAGTFTLELTGEAESVMISVEIYGILGNQMLKTDIPWEKLHTFDLSASQPGIYLIRVLYGKEAGMAKIIRQ